MRRLIAIVNIFFVLSIILAGCGGSDDDNQAASPTERADFVDVAASWNEDRSAAVMVDSDGNIMTARSGSIVWRVPDDKNFVVFYDGSGLPTRVVGEGYVILYGNWTATTVDIAVMSSDGTYTVNKNVAADSSSMTSVSGDTLAENIKASGTIASGAVCAAGVAAAQSSAGTLSALTALACASTAMNVGTLLIPEDNEDLSGTAEKIPTFVSATSSALECVPDEVLACVDGVVVSSTPAKSAAENYMADKSVAITIAESDLLGHSKIPDTGQTSCYNVAGSIITTCPAPEDPMAQDGSYTANAPSYTVNSDETVTDNETYLLWQKDGSTNLTWDGAVSYCSSLPLGG
ncbi:MAG: DUF1566 domain-containing protein, partial [Proteobacteria bacterium]|nr:DUF1566 domain-containing protein [Pseudomonadota bacterium]